LQYLNLTCILLIIYAYFIAQATNFNFINY